LIINTANRASSLLFQYLIQSKIDSWILPANICFIVPLTFIKAKKNIVFIDINANNFLIDEIQVFELLKKQNKAIGIMLNHSFGIEKDYSDFIKSIKEKHPKTEIIEDKCLCVPKFETSTSPDIDLILYSTGYAKYCDIGFGGFGYSNVDLENSCFDFNNNTLFLDSIKNEIEKKQSFTISEDVYKNWLDNRELPIEMELYIKKILENINVIKKHKETINKIYKDKLPKEIQLGSEFQNWRFNILVKNKYQILKEIFNNRLFASSHYPDMKFYFEGEKAQNTSSIHNKIINLFNDKNIDSNQALRIVEIINSNLK